MAKNTNKGAQRLPQPSRPVAAPKPKLSQLVKIPELPNLDLPEWLNSFKTQAIIVGFLAIALYCNTFQHEYALDDTIVIAKNEYVYEGFAGLKDIFTRDGYDSYYKQFNSSNQLAGGRYRPLSFATFAIEQQFLGPIPASKVDSVVQHAGEGGPQEKKLISDMHVRHVLNVLWYTLAVIALLYFLRKVVFKTSPVMALIAAIIFTIHPLHTEVVANVKSRDEILSILFMSLTFIYAFRYEEEKAQGRKWLIVALSCFMLAFLSKEYAVGLMILLPLAFYLFKGYDVPKSIMACVPYFIVTGVYMVIRKMIVAPMSEDSVNDILNNPYALATDAERVATQISTTLNYLKLLIFPHPLSADYSYNTIPYKEFSHPQVLISLAVHIGLIVAFVKLLKQRHVLSFAIAFYMINILLICNLIFNIGGTMGERLCFHSSAGFAMAVAYLLVAGAAKLQSEMSRKALVGVCTVAIIGLCSYKTIDRNRYWKNDQTLFFEDIKVAPNSVLVNADVASSYINLSENEKTEWQRQHSIHTGLKYFAKAIEINPSFVSGYANSGMAYFKLKKPDSAFYSFSKVAELYPRYPRLGEMFYNVGVNFYLEKRYSEAIKSWNICLRMDITPQIRAQAQNALQVLANQGITR